MRGLFTGLFLLIYCIAVPAYVHDIGVSQAEWVEQTDDSYLLKVQTGSSMTMLFATPQLPQHCEFTSNPPGIQGPGWQTFKFTCNNGLTAEYTLILPWRRDGILLTANWIDESSAKGLFKYDAGQITVPLVELQVGSGCWFAAAKRYTGLGIEHILLGLRSPAVRAGLAVYRARSMDAGEDDHGVHCRPRYYPRAGDTGFHQCTISFR